MSVYNHEKHLVYITEPLAYSTSNTAGLEPRKPDITDAGFVLPLTARCNNRIDDKSFDYNEFTTEMSLFAPPNHYILILASDELLQKGYTMMPVIHQPRNFDSPIKVKLYKAFDVEDLMLPVQGALRAVLLPSCHCHLVPIKSSTKLNLTEDRVKHMNLTSHQQTIAKDSKGWFS
jgi:hypothetical protein